MRPGPFQFALAAREVQASVSPTPSVVDPDVIATDRIAILHLALLHFANLHLTILRLMSPD
jgi:hypothetical protein